MNKISQEIILILKVKDIRVIIQEEEDHRFHLIEEIMLLIEAEEAKAKLEEGITTLMSKITDLIRLIKDQS